MTEEEAKGVKNQEAAGPEAKSEEVNQQQVSQEPSAEPTKGTKEYNWRQMEKNIEKLQRQNEELLRREAEKSKPPPPKEDDDLTSLTDDDIITVAQARKLSQKQAEEIVNQTLEKREKLALPERTRGQFGDFDEIMTEENIKKLENDEPGLAAACAKAPNPWEATYKILKKFVVPQKEDKATRGDEKIKENLSKPISSNSVGKPSPLSNANLWSEASQEDLYKEMMQAARQVR